MTSIDPAHRPGYSTAVPAQLVPAQLARVPSQANRTVKPIALTDPNHPWSWLLRYGVWPFLLGLDLVACILPIILLPESFRSKLVFAVVLLALMAAGNFYRSRLSLSILDDLPRLLGRWLAAIPLTVLVQVGWSRVVWNDYAVNWEFIKAAAVMGALVLAFRVLGYAAVRRQRSRRRVAHRTLVLGAGHIGTQVADVLIRHPEYGLHPIGFLDAEPRTNADRSGLPVLGDPESLADVLIDGNIHNVVVAFSSMQESQVVSLIRTCDRLACELFVVPRLFELHHVSSDMDTVWGLPLVRLRRAPYRTRAWRAKRLVDIVASATALLLLSIPMALIAAAVRLEGGPGILFRQERVGVDGRRFLLMKFRSLKPADEDESATNWNIAHDDRLGPVGKVLRKTSLDELPQLVNILRGDMSIVGPRPERPHFVRQFQATYPNYVARHRVPSGLTGWAQVHGLRGDTSIAERARFDNYYIENWSLWLDVKIILRTVGSVLRGSGA